MESNRSVRAVTSSTVARTAASSLASGAAPRCDAKKLGTENGRVNQPSTHAESNELAPSRLAP